jgi:hypothetical protein
MRWAGQVAHRGEMINVHKTLVGIPEGKYHLKDLGVDGWIILEWILEEWNAKLWTGFIWLRIGTSGGLL